MCATPRHVKMYILPLIQLSYVPTVFTEQHEVSSDGIRCVEIRRDTDVVPYTWTFGPLAPSLCEKCFHISSRVCCNRVEISASRSLAVWRESPRRSRVLQPTVRRQLASEVADCASPTHSLSDSFVGLGIQASKLPTHHHQAFSLVSHGRAACPCSRSWDLASERRQVL